MKRKKLWAYPLVLLGVFAAFYLGKRVNPNPFRDVGQPIDSLNGVYVYYNGGVGNVEERNMAGEYNLGLKYQCVEFVKRYYYEYYDHQMPDSYGHARDFFKEGLADGALNTERDLRQYTNPSREKPKVGDLIVFGPSLLNRYGHVAIVSKVNEQALEITQQNPGPFGDSREDLPLHDNCADWEVGNDRVVGWLRK